MVIVPGYDQAYISKNSTVDLMVAISHFYFNYWMNNGFYTLDAVTSP